MKKLKLILLLAVLCMPFLQSCNDKIDQPSQYALVTIRTMESSVGSNWIGILDNGDKMYVGDATRVANYKPKDGQRAIVYFNELETPVSGYKYNAAVYGVEEILTKPTITLDDKQYDTLGTDNIGITKAWIAGGYLTVEYNVIYNGMSKHILNLAYNTVEVLETKDGYTTLDFRHDAKGVKDGQLARGYVCFRLNEYDPELTGDKGLYIRYKTFRSGGDSSEGTVKYITVEPGKDATIE